MRLNFTYRGLIVRAETYYNYDSGKLSDRGYTLRAYQVRRFWFDKCVLDGDYELPFKVSTTELLARVKLQLDALVDMIEGKTDELQYLESVTGEQDE
jgi:hypothetical protein